MIYIIKNLKNFFKFLYKETILKIFKKFNKKKKKECRQII
jgi:hypothetical protein